MVKVESIPTTKFPGREILRIMCHSQKSRNWVTVGNINGKHKQLMSKLLMGKNIKQPAILMQNLPLFVALL